MKIHIWDRLLAIISGLILIFSGIWLFLERKVLLPLINTSKASEDVKSWVFLGCSLLFLVLGLNLVINYIFRGTKKNKGKIIQETDYGALSISVKAIEGMVEKCVAEYKELELISTSVANTRDGMNVRLKISLAKGINIPLAVNTLQKQIREYVTSCSGIDVGQVQVEIISAEIKGNGEKTASRSFMIEPETQKPKDTSPAPSQKEEKQEKEKDEERSFHQKLFGHKEEKEENLQPVETAAPVETEKTSILEEKPEESQDLPKKEAEQKKEPIEEENFKTREEL